MTGPLTGTWAARNKTVTAAPLKPGPDPEHTTPTDNPEYIHTTPMWQSTTQMPGLPEELLASPNPELATGIGPVDATPESHDFGVGIGSGLTVIQSQDRMGPIHADDRGSVAAHRWVHATDRDGQFNLEEIPDQPGYGESPQTNTYRQWGVGAPTDPYARSAKRYKRWVDRFIDMHRWTVQPGPVKPQYARPNPSRGAVLPGDQVVPPYGNSVAFDGRPPDRFVMQTVRRQPENWVDNQATDGSEQIGDAVNQYGLRSWGL